MSSTPFEETPELLHALLWARQHGWPTSEQDIALGHRIWARIQAENLTPGEATTQLLTRLIAELPKSGSPSKDDVLHRAILVRMLWMIKRHGDSSNDGSTNDA